MSRRRIKQHPGIDSTKPSLIEREAYLQELARLQKSLQPGKEFQEQIKQLQKSLQPGKEFQEQIKQGMGSSLCLTLDSKREELNVDFVLSIESFEA